MTHPKTFPPSTAVKLLRWGKTYSGSINTDRVRKMLNNPAACLLQNVTMAQTLGRTTNYTFTEPCPVLEFVGILTVEASIEYALYKSITVPNLHVLLWANDCESIAVINEKMEVPLTL